MKSDDKGDYKASTDEKSTDAAGTTSEDKSADKVTTSSNGDSTEKASSTTSTDPKGGAATSTSKSEDVKVKGNGDVNGTSSSETKGASATDTTKNKVSSSTDKHGLKTTKVTHKKKHNPKGLTNKSSTETSTDMTKQKADGTTETQHVVKDDGKTVEKSDTTAPTTTPATTPAQ